jgi:cytochrome c peroxidase
VKGGDDKGRFEVTANTLDQYKFKVPPLRNIGLTAPYMHSGSLKSLWHVINHYNDPVASIRYFNWESRHPNYRDPLNLDTNSANVDNRESNLSRALARNLGLTMEQRYDLYCFLAVALTDVSLQKDLISKGVVNEVSDCSPRTR